MNRGLSMHFGVDKHRGIRFRCQIILFLFAYVCFAYRVVLVRIMKEVLKDDS